jgi:hypothetical protein
MKVPEGETRLWVPRRVPGVEDSKLMVDWDWLDIELGRYKDSLDRRVREAYLAAHSVLEREHRQGQEKLQHDLDKAADEEDMAFNRDIVTYEEGRWTDQTEALAAMALALLASLNKSFLDEQKNQMNRTHPPAPKGYGGKSVLLKQVAEYKARFRLDLEKIDGFDALREVELARHCCLHGGGALTKDYETQTKQRLVGERGDIDMTPKTLDLLIRELSEFADSLSSQMREIRKREKMKEKNL